MEPTQKPKTFLWITVAFAVIALAAGWYYYRNFRGSAVLPAGEDTATAKLETQGTSDEVSAIEEDMNATDLGDLDRELSDIDAQLAQ